MRYTEIDGQRYEVKTADPVPIGTWATEDLEYALNDGRPYYKSKPRLEMRF